MPLNCMTALPPACGAALARGLDAPGFLLGRDKYPKRLMQATGRSPFRVMWIFQFSDGGKSRGIFP